MTNTNAEFIKRMSQVAPFDVHGFEWTRILALLEAGQALLAGVTEYRDPHGSTTGHPRSSHLIWHDITEAQEMFRILEVVG